MITKRKLTDLFRSLGIYLIVWILAFVFFTLIRRFGTADVIDNVMITRPRTINVFQLVIPISIILSLLSVITDKIMSVKRTMHMSYGKVMLLSFLLNMGMLVITMIVAYRGLHRLGLHEIAPSEDVFREIFSKNFIVVGVFISVMNILFSIARLVNANMGKGNLWKLITGKYHTPREESFIFMFLDLKSSTTAAEQIGHIKYSEMIQECYYDLTIPLQKYEGAVYQYVGDEAVIYWNPQNGLRETNCLKLFFEFDKLLRKKKDLYLEKYGWQPEFKASVHIGPAIVTQVGSIKREIAFHGDTLNTAARIQALCNAKASKILISETLQEQISNSSADREHFSFLEKGEEALKGRNEKMGVFGVEKSGEG
jgi:adenylate cyclase